MILKNFSNLLCIKSSSKAIFKEEKAIRGGVPIIFPQFGGGPLPQHGFGRNSKFDLLETSVAGDSNSGILLEP